METCARCSDNKIAEGTVDYSGVERFEGPRWRGRGWESFLSAGNVAKCDAVGTTLQIAVRVRKLGIPD